MQLGHSELIINADGSIYHLNLLPTDIADTIITVGDPDRVAHISKHFDHIELKKGKREVLTHTGRLNGHRITVISTGIGTDNIDIVLNELDALANVDFETRKLKKNRIRLNIIRIGTSGAIQPNIPVDSFILSEYAIGFDGLLHCYADNHIQHSIISDAFVAHTRWSPKRSLPYVVDYDEGLGSKFMSNHIRLGFTATNIGFYGPQGRTIYLKVQDGDLNTKIASFRYQGMAITNLEMETSGIYGLAKLMGHRAVSLNCILANRSTGEFSKNPAKAVEELIVYTLDKLTQN